MILWYYLFHAFNPRWPTTFVMKSWRNRHFLCVVARHVSRRLPEDRNGAAMPGEELYQRLSNVIHFLRLFSKAGSLSIGLNSRFGFGAARDGEDLVENIPLSVQLLPALHLTCILLSKEHQNLITEAHSILATVSLKLRARITKLQGDVPEALKHGISLVRLIICTNHVKLAAAERIAKGSRSNELLAAAQPRYLCYAVLFTAS